MSSKIKSRLYSFVILLCLLFGVFLRLRFFTFNNVFEDDECRLAVFIYNKSLLEMFLPIGPLSSSPIFLFFSKIIASITNWNEQSLKFIPLLCSLASIVMFYKLTTVYFKHKISIFLANLLFAFNAILVMFSGMFKQYSMEVLLTLICLYYLPKINIKDLDVKQILLTSLTLAVFLLASLPSLVIVGCFVLINIQKNLKDKDFYKKLFLFLLPLSVVAIIYYVYNLAPTKALQMKYYATVWTNVYSQGVGNAIILYLRYVFQPIGYILIPLTLMFCGIISILFDKENRTDYDKYTILCFIVVILAHVLKLYPLYMRVSNFLIPIVFLLAIKSFDSIIYRKPIYYLLIAVSTIFLFGQYFTPKSMMWIVNLHENAIIYSPKVLLTDMKTRFNSDTDIVITNEASLSSFIFYSKQLNFTNNSFICLKRLVQLNNLEKDKKYWFYLVKDFNHSPVVPFIKKWLEIQNIEYIKEDKDSCLYYIKPPYKKVPKELMNIGEKFVEYYENKI